MRKKLLTRIILITTIGLLIGIILSLTIFNIMNYQSVRESLKNSSNSVLRGIEHCQDYNDIDKMLKFSDNVVLVTILDSNNNLVYDSSNMEIRDKGIKQVHVNEVREKGLSVHVGKPYEGNATMLMYYVTFEGPQLDSNGPLVLRSSMAIAFNNAPFWTSFCVGLIIWVGIIVGSYFIIQISVKAAIEPVSNIEKSLKALARGDFEETNCINLGDKDLDDVYLHLSEISTQISSSFQEIKNEQAKSKFLMQAISQGVMALSRMGTIMLNNHALDEIFENEDLGGVSIDYVLDKDILDIVKKALNDKSYSIGTMRKNNSVYRVECIPVDMHDSIELSNIKLLVIFTDITQEVETANIRNEFFANASHELKTPLTAISGYSEIITLGRDETTTQKCAKEIMNNATKMKDLINDMMKLSKLDAKLDVEDESTFDLYDLCQEVVDEQIMIANNKKVTLKLDGAHVNILGRRNMIKVVVQNLVNNAIKYNKENGSVYVNVNKDDHYTTLVVKDTGIGIPKEHQGRLFERFYKVDNARTRTEESSTGLGLAIVKNIIIMHKAQIHVDSKEDVGTTMTVRFNNLKEKISK